VRRWIEVGGKGDWWSEWMASTVAQTENQLRYRCPMFRSVYCHDGLIVSNGIMSSFMGGFREL
jgi:hypothetical protein